MKLQLRATSSYNAIQCSHHSSIY